MAQPITPVGGISLVIHLLVHVIGFVLGFYRTHIKTHMWLHVVFIAVILLSLVSLGGLLINSYLTRPVKLAQEPSQDTPLSSLFKNPVPSSEIGVWIAYWDEDAALKSLGIAKNEIKTISPLWYHINENGDLFDTEAVKIAEFMNIASSSHIRVMPTINNEIEDGFDPERVSKILNDSAKSDRLIEKLVQTAKTQGYHGWDIDWEFIKEKDKDAFTKFIKNLADKLHGNGLKLSVTVHAQIGMPQEKTVSGGQDLERLSAYADEIRVMAYDFHNAYSNPGAIADLEKIKQTIDFSLTQIPEAKFVLGLPLHGYDWGSGQGQPIQFGEVMDIIKNNSAPTERHALSGELVAQYDVEGVRHQVWFQDHESLQAKIKLAREHGLHNFFLWRLGREDPLIWATYKNHD